MGQGIGAEAAYGVAGMRQAIRQRVLDKLQLDQFDEEKRRNLADEDLRRMQIESAAELKRQAESDRQQRDREVADVRGENAATRQIGTMRRDTTVSPEDYGRLSRYGYGSGYFEHEAPTMPSTEIGGFSSLPGGNKPIIGKLIRKEQSANPERYKFLGTSQQDLADERTQTQRDIADARNDAASARGQATDAYRNAALSLREQNQQRLQDQFSQTHPQDNPELPHGVGDFLLQLRGTHGNNLQAAEQQLNATLPELRAAHPHLNTTKAVSALRGMFAAPAGASKVDQLLQDLGVNGGGSGGTMPPNAATGGRGGAPGAAASPRPTLGKPTINSNQIVTLKSGQRVRVTKTYPDGTFDYEAAR